MDRIVPLEEAPSTAPRMRRYVVVASIAAALAVPSLALAGGSPIGTYSTSITSPPDFRGTWALSLAKGGAFTLSLDGRMLVRGRYSTTGSKVTFGRDEFCSKPGTYTWKKSGKTLRFKRVSDSPACDGRIELLSHTFTLRG